MLTYFKKAAPFPYEIPLKADSASSTDLILLQIGWVVFNTSAEIPLNFLAMKSTQASLKYESSGIWVYDKYAMYVANDSLSQRSFHHFIVTRFPNQWWANSCKFVFASFNRWCKLNFYPLLR